MRILCFDVGGTNIKYALIDRKIEEVEVFNIETRITKERNYILEDIVDIIGKYENLDAVGISTAGIVDSKNGRIDFAGPTITNYTGTEFKKTIEEKFGLPCFVENDVNSAAYGEYMYGNYEDDLFCMTIGTGIGGSLILDGKIYKGYRMCAGEIGYLPYKDGHFQDYTSASVLTKYVSEKLGKKVDGKYIFENAKKGDKLCNEAIDMLIENLSFVILTIVYTLNPRNIVIGGGITAQGKYLEDKIVSKFKEKLINERFNCNISLAKLRNSAGIYGIYNIVRKEIEKCTI